MVLHEVQHVGTVLSCLLPAACYCSGRLPALHNGAQRVIEPHLVIDVVKPSVVNVTAVGAGVIEFSYELYLFVRFLYY